VTDKRLLIVDDEPDFATFVSRVGKQLGHDVRIAADAEAFKELCISFDPTIIVLDIVMPEIDGIELIKWLGANHTTAKIIAISGANPLYSSSAQHIGDGFGINVTAVSKPISLADLKAALSH